MCIEIKSEEYAYLKTSCRKPARDLAYRWRRPPPKKKKTLWSVKFFQQMYWNLYLQCKVYQTHVLEPLFEMYYLTAVLEPVPEM